MVNQQEPTDEEVLLSLQGGNTDALVVLYGRYYDRFLGWTIKEKQLLRQDAEEAVQDTFYRVARYIDTYKPGKPRKRSQGENRNSKAESWLWTIHRRVVDQRLEKAAKESRRWKQLEEALKREVLDAVPNDAEESEHWWQEVEQRVQWALLHLHPDEQDEMRRGRGKAGPVRDTYEQACRRFREFYDAWPKASKGEVEGATAP